MDAWSDDEFSSAMIYIENTAPDTYLTDVPLTVKLDTQDSQFGLRVSEESPFSQTLSVTLMNGVVQRGSAKNISHFSFPRPHR